LSRTATPLGSRCPAPDRSSPSQPTPPVATSGSSRRPARQTASYATTTAPSSYRSATDAATSESLLTSSQDTDRLRSGRGLPSRPQREVAPDPARLERAATLTNCGLGAPLPGGCALGGFAFDFTPDGRAPIGSYALLGNTARKFMKSGAALHRLFVDAARSGRGSRIRSTEKPARSRASE
jgi:hypothetical protein